MNHVLDSPRALVAHVLSAGQVRNFARNDRMTAALMALPEKVKAGLAALGKLRSRRAQLAAQLGDAADHLNDQVDVDALDGHQRRAWSQRLRQGVEAIAVMDKQVTELQGQIMAIA